MSPMFGGLAVPRVPAFFLLLRLMAAHSPVQNSPAVSSSLKSSRPVESVSPNAAASSVRV